MRSNFWYSICRRIVAPQAQIRSKNAIYDYEFTTTAMLCHPLIDRHLSNVLPVSWHIARRSNFWPFPESPLSRRSDLGSYRTCRFTRYRPWDDCVRPSDRLKGCPLAWRPCGIPCDPLSKQPTLPVEIGPGPPHHEGTERHRGL